MSMKKMILLAVIMIVFCAVFIVATGDVYYVEHNFYRQLSNPEDYRIEIEEGSEHINIENFRVESDKVKFTVHALSEGKAVVDVYQEESTGTVFIFYVHKTGFITESSLFGNCRSGNIIIVMMTIYAAVLLGIFIRKFIDNVRKDYYSYHNITLLGMIIFISTLIFNNMVFAFNRNGLMDFIQGILTAPALTVFLIPPAFLVTVGIFVSNIVLIVKEGANKKNIMGTVFSFIYLIFLVFPIFFEGFLQLQNVIDVHRENGFGHYLEIIVTNFCYSVTGYITIILIATIIIGIRSAYRKIEFDKDYILILGCRIRKDGSVTPLLKGRADAAVSFANKQKNATGKDIFFVPSGGKGKDETVSEAEAVKNYLLSCNIAEDRIITEDKCLQFWNDFSPIVLSVFGSTTEERLVHPINADVLIDTRELPKDALVRLPQERKA